MNDVRRATMIWLFLMVLTLIAAVLGGVGMTDQASKPSDIGLWITLGSLIILIIKGQLVVDFFMGLKVVNPLWRLLLSAYCVVISAFVLLAYVLGMH